MMAWEAAAAAVLGLLMDATKKPDDLSLPQKPQTPGAGFSHQPVAGMSQQRLSQIMQQPTPEPGPTDIENNPAALVPQAAPAVAPQAGQAMAATPQGAPQAAGGNSQLMGNIAKAAEIGTMLAGAMGQQSSVPGLPPLPGGGGGGFQYTPSAQLSQQRLKSIYG